MATVLAAFAQDWGPAIVFMPQMIVSLGNGLLLPGAISGAVSVRPQAAGTAAGITGCAQMALGAAITQYAGTLLAGAASAVPLAVLMDALVIALAVGVRAAGAAAADRHALPFERRVVYRCIDRKGETLMTTTTSSRLLPACLALAALLPLDGGGARAETLDQLYEKAKAEKEVVFYSGGPAAPHENRAKLFMQQFPGITVSVTGGFSNVLNEQIEKQMADKKLAVDMAFFQTVQDFVTWKKQGKLLNFKPDGFDQIYPNFRDPDGAYMALSANALTYAYNTSQGPRRGRAEVGAGFPASRCSQGKVITVYPADDDATLYLFHTIVQKYGWGWMDKYMANKPNFVQGHLPVARSVASGENIATFDASSSVWPFKREGKLEVVFSPVDQTPVFTLTGGIFKDAPHPNAAKLYLTWFLAKEQQSRRRLVLLARRRAAAGGLQAADRRTRSPTTIASS